MPRLLHHSPASNGGRRIFLAIPCDRPAALTAFCLAQSQIALHEAGFETEIS